MRRKLRMALAALVTLALLAANACWAEPMPADDLTGDLIPRQDAAETDAEAPVVQTNPLDAELVMGYVAAENARVNPFRCNERDLVSANQLVFEPLVTLDDTRKPAPMLADNWTHEDKTWTFTLRSGITFHNGAELTAYDVVASYEAFVTSEYDNPYSTRIKALIAGMEATGDRTLTVQAVYSGLITLYAMDFPVVHASTVNDDLPRGTGPYWYTYYEFDSVLRIEANPLWWKKQPTSASIAFKRYAEVSEAIEGLQTGEIELLATQSSTAALSRKLSNLTSMDYGTTVYEYLLPNLGSRSVMSDVNVRKAVMYAIDRSVLASNAYLDMAIQSEVPVLPGTWLYESQSAVYHYSPERALQYLYDSGWKDLNGDTVLDRLNGIQLEELTVNIITYNESTTSIRENAVYLISNYLNAVGIKTKVEVLSKEKAASRIRDRDFDLALIGVNLSEVPILQPLLSSDGSLNLNGYGDDWMDGWIGETSTESDETRLKELYSSIQMKVVDRLPIMGLLFRTGTVLSTRSLGGLSGIRPMNTFRGLEYLTD